MDFIAGRGVFLTEPRPLNAFLVEYYGELISAKEGIQRESSLDDKSVFRYFFRHKRREMW